MPLRSRDNLSIDNAHKIALAEAVLGHDLDPRLGDRDDLIEQDADTFNALPLKAVYVVLASHLLIQHIQQQSRHRLGKGRVIDIVI